MLLFQLQAKKKGEEEDYEHSRQGMKVGRKAGPLAQENAFSVLADDYSSSVERLLGDKTVADFIATLTPGAQNAIRAYSFAWGYENAAKHVKNAMKLEEVKNAADAAEKSRAVVESLQEPGGRQKSSDVSKFAWSYYNEDMKESQAQSGRSEAMTQKPGQEEQEQLHLPQSAGQAVALGVASGSHSPALLYCAGAANAVQQEREQQSFEQKREELSRLVTPSEKSAEHARLLEQESARKMLDDANHLALERQQELARQYAELEKQLQQALRFLDNFRGEEQELEKKLAAKLPDTFAHLLLSRHLYSKKAARSQIQRWLAFCSEGRKSISALPASKLLKIVSLSSLLRLGK